LSNGNGSVRRAERPPPENESPAAVGAAAGPKKKSAVQRQTNTRTSGGVQAYSREWPLFLTDGRVTLGYVWTDKRGRFAAATADRVSLGAFRSLKEASQAVFSAKRDARAA
jgi:hypothetical protein